MLFNKIINKVKEKKEKKEAINFIFNDKIEIKDTSKGEKYNVK